MRFSTVLAAAAAGLLTISLASGAVAQEGEEQEFEIEDKIEVRISGSHWQKCEVTENDPAMNFMRARCKEYRALSIRRAAGMYIVSRSPADTRRDKTAATQGLPEGAFLNQ